jgi:hypothetical protein
MPNNKNIIKGESFKETQMTISIKKICLMGFFIALGVTLGYALTAIPNVEMITATVFIAGYLLGVKEGIVIGLFTEALYSLLNPYGVASPPLFIAQIISMSIAGGIGGFCRRYTFKSKWMYRFTIGLSGGFSTLLFAALTSIADGLFLGFNLKQFLAYLLSGILFYITHIGTNILIFIFLVPLLIRTAEKTALFPSASKETSI